MDKQSEQFKWIVKILNENDINYWVYGGTLLRLRREGDLSKSQGDIDIAFWPPEIEKLKRLRGLFESEGYRVKVSYFGWPRSWSFVRKIDLLPANNDAPAKIEFGFFRKYDNEWCWASCAIRKQFEETKPITIKFQEFCYKQAKKLSKRKPPSHGLLWKGLFEFHAIRFPYKFFDELAEYQFDDVTYLGPKDRDDYLEFVYGDWENPVRNWEYMKRYEKLFFPDDITRKLIRDAK